MSIVLRIVLIVASILMTYYIMKKIRNSKAQIEDSLFWIFFSIMLIIFGIFPIIPFALSTVLGFAAPVNFIFLFIFFILIVKIFTMSLKVSTLETKLRDLTQEIAIRDRLEKDGAKTEDVKEEGQQE